jgi:hypothetical protein
VMTERLKWAKEHVTRWRTEQSGLVQFWTTRSTDDLSCHLLVSTSTTRELQTSICDCDAFGSHDRDAFKPIGGGTAGNETRWELDSPGWIDGTSMDHQPVIPKKTSCTMLKMILEFTIRKSNGSWLLVRL